jgi:hypothetical protein
MTPHRQDSSMAKAFCLEFIRQGGIFSKIQGKTG